MKKHILSAGFVLIALTLLCGDNPGVAQYGGGMMGGGMGGWQETSYLVLEAEPEQIDAYLEELLAKETPFPPHYQAYLDAETKIRAELAKKTELDLIDMPFADAVQQMQELHGIYIILDQPVLEEAGIDTNEVVNFTASGVTARSALDLILNQLTVPLTWIIKDEMLVITTLEEHDFRQVTKFYDVSDLVISREGPGELLLDYEPLKNAIKEGCDETALWHEDDGEGGTIVPYDALGIHALSIRQTRQIHDEIEVILAGLRRMRKPEPALFKNVRRVTVEPPDHPGAPGGQGGDDDEEKEREECEEKQKE